MMVKTLCTPLNSLQGFEILVLEKAKYKHSITILGKTLHESISELFCFIPAHMTYCTQFSI